MENTHICSLFLFIKLISSAEVRSFQLILGTSSGNHYCMSFLLKILTTIGTFVKSGSTSLLESTFSLWLPGVLSNFSHGSLEFWPDILQNYKFVIWYCYRCTRWVCLFMYWKLFFESFNGRFPMRNLFKYFHWH